MLGPRVYEEDLYLEVNVRVLEGEDTSVYAIDGIYAYDGVEGAEFLDEVYPWVLAQFEEKLGDAQLQYFDS